LEPQEDEDDTSSSSPRPLTIRNDGGKQLNEDGPLFLGLGSDNLWYAFSATTVHNILQAEVGDVFKESVQTILSDKLPTEIDAWQTVGKSGKSKLPNIWCSNGSLDTLSLSKKVPIDNGSHNGMVIGHFSHHPYIHHNFCV
jgi:hypothetical protein